MKDLKCCQCGKIKKYEEVRKLFTLSIPFLKERSDKDYNEYYCGCYGWD